jgi:HPt (histidine-containing phosphotransfer) domain-containing protein
MEQKLYDLTSLKEVTGEDKEFMNSMIQLILLDTPKDLKAMEIALENENYTKVSSIAHKIKPSVHLVCTANLFEDVKAVEKWESQDVLMIEKTMLLIANIFTLLNQIRNME